MKQMTEPTHEDIDDIDIIQFKLTSILYMIY